MSFDPSRIDLDALPWVAFDNRRGLPIHQGIYFALAADGTVLYIGKSRNIFVRWMTHHRIADLAKQEGVTISWLRFDGDVSLLDAIERACIKYFQPALNRRPVGQHGRYVRRTHWFRASLLERVRQLAEQEQRSVSRQLCILLEIALDAYDDLE